MINKNNKKSPSLITCFATLLLLLVNLSVTPSIAQQAAVGQATASGTSMNKSGILWSALNSYEHDLSDDVLEISRSGTHVLSGKSVGGINVDTDGNVRLILNGVEVRSNNGAAINIVNAKNTVIELATASENYLEDANTRKDDGIDGVIYSSDDLTFQGDGALTVKANFKDGIVSKDDLDIFSGEFSIYSVDDGIRGKDSLTISGGVISVIAEGDGIKSTNEDDPEKGSVYINNATVTITSGDDGISAINNIVIDGGKVNILESYEGMESSNIVINGGDISVVADDDGINAVNKNGLRGMSITVNGGNVDVTVGSGDTDAFDSNGTILIAGGNINITAPTSAIDSDGVAQMTGGTLVVNGEVLTEIPEGRRGRRGGGMGGGGMGDRS